MTKFYIQNKDGSWTNDPVIRKGNGEIAVLFHKDGSWNIFPLSDDYSDIAEGRSKLRLKLILWLLGE